MRSNFPLVMLAAIAIWQGLTYVNWGSGFLAGAASMVIVITLIDRHVISTPIYRRWYERLAHVHLSASHGKMSDLGRIKSPYGGITHCANADCATPELSEELGAYMYRDLESDKLVILCGDCARYVELNAAQRFKLLAL